MLKIFKGKFKIICMLLCLSTVLATTLTACTDDKSKEDKSAANKPAEEKQEVDLFVAASLTDAINEIVKDFEKENPGAKVVVNADSSGKLKTQIMEGFNCDIFLSASTKEVKELKEKNMLIDDSIKDVLQNQLAILANKDYDGKVKNLETIKDAKSIALAYGSVPAGFYARKAMIADGILKAKNDEKDTIKAITGKEVSEALGGVTISEKQNVSTVLSSVAEKSTEVGFAYVSDAKRNSNVKIISEIPTDKTGKITYPIAKVKAKKESKDKEELVNKLYKALTDDNAKKVYEKFGFKAN